MTDEKNDKKDDDLIGNLNDVMGERKVADAPAPVKEKTDMKKKPSHEKFNASSMQDTSVANEDIVWLTVNDKLYNINDISPIDFMTWVYDKLPGTKKRKILSHSQCDTAQKRLDIFQEVVKKLEQWYIASKAESKKDTFGF